jgi:hypothetical protein
VERAADKTARGRPFIAGSWRFAVGFYFSFLFLAILNHLMRNVGAAAELS